MQSSQSNVEMRQAPPVPTEILKKRTWDEFVKPQELLGKFRSKSDFILYFTESCKSMQLST